MKVIVIGSTFAGTYAVQELLSMHPDAEVTIYEKEATMSFVSSGIALYLNGEVNELDNLYEVKPKSLFDLGVDIHLNTNVTNIDPTTKTIRARSLETGEEIEDSYDKLLFTPGSFPIMPPIRGIENEKVMLARNAYDAKMLSEASNSAKSLIVVGAGYIGVEIAEAFNKKGSEVTIIQGSGRVLRKYHDELYSNEIITDFEHNGVKVILSEIVEGFKDTDDGRLQVTTNKGTYVADRAIVSVGSRASSQLLRGKVELGRNGEVLVDKYMRTSNPDIMAAGDVATSFNNPANKDVYIPLGSTAVRQGTIMGMNVYEPIVKYTGTQASSGIKIYDVSTVTTGLTMAAARKNGLNADDITVQSTHRIVDKDWQKLDEAATLTVVYDKDSNYILGAQMRSRADISQTINTISIAIQKKLTIQELAVVDQVSQSTDQSFNLLNLAGKFAANKIRKNTMKKR
ncbi:NADH oxidase [Periweissella cryptocerci]|uniref:NADH oxidase n=1 Tax=Periweissella cryptocerci TaxID=2506420 RepID=A0A4P6YTT8_9LACO|nr:FAD-dependent oxidoreductase [Periweissella cryptocerci]QBO36106.1 NADH oxidase [Periweissella cryptocerci]